ncbi:uncharacterized protein LOC103280728 [Anolis carolinensis]|uniref:uncharacterized protein LOC103280728 n=1 Tax=Anolis carolinensis TaxID=28377 RepID=UPI0007DB7A4A|nr:PREDICTED: uncharacterized protein LOC103280728 [Anolis carolinensis]|eukprot:XP_008118910.2 PREDICTED: uncharacterized protein LOC103280728 [Anolis carolinensis]
MWHAEKTLFLWVDLFLKGGRKGLHPWGGLQTRKKGVACAFIPPTQKIEKSPPRKQSYLNQSWRSKEVDLPRSSKESSARAPPGVHSGNYRASFPSMAKAGFLVLQAASLSCLLLLASSALPPSVGGKRDGPFRLREHLWATGHFMGKKSNLGPLSHLWSPSMKHPEPDNIPEASKSVLEDGTERLRRELLTLLLQWSLAEENQEQKKEPKEQEISPLRKLLAKYI